MSQSQTTNTRTWLLNKYSRCYSTKSAVAPTDWQHYPSPTIRLNLDQTCSADGSLVSIKLQIVLLVDADDGSMHSQVGKKDQLTFEDLDLLEYSTRAFSNPLPVRNDGSSQPLRAVYQDKTVGLRYMHPFPPIPGSAVAFRRFQVTFSDSAACMQFVHAIASVCPCHANSDSTKKRAPMSAPPPPPPSSTPLSSSPTLPSDASTSFKSAWPPAKRQKLSSGPSTPLLFVQPQIPEPPSPSTSPPSEPVQSFRSIGHSDLRGPNCDLATQILPTEVMRSTSGVGTNSFDLRETAPPAGANAINTSNTVLAANPLTPRAYNQPSLAPNPLLSVLQQMPDMYKLPVAQLEDIVAEVVREPGFMEFLEKLESMWQVRGFVGR